MINKRTVAVFSVLIFVITFSFFIIPMAEADGIVHCGNTSNIDDRCKLCDLIIGIKAVIDFGKNILVAVALTAIVAGGIMYIVSAGNEQMMQAAKGVLKQALIGMVIVLGAWLIVNTTMWLLATEGDLGVDATSWSDFNCDGGAVEAAAASMCGSASETCINSGVLEGIAMSVDGLCIWSCSGEQCNAAGSCW
jgi:type IV secretion system pilin